LPLQEEEVKQESIDKPKKAVIESDEEDNWIADMSEKFLNEVIGNDIHVSKNGDAKLDKGEAAEKEGDNNNFES
jgi:hypothetical protein